MKRIPAMECAFYFLRKQICYSEGIVNETDFIANLIALIF